jgi:hypothetical protein
MRELRREDVFISRLKLLIVMSLAYLEECPLGEFRKESILHNANQVAREIVDWRGRNTNFRSDHERLGSVYDHIFFQRIKLLAVMAKAVAEDHPMGFHRLKAMEDNVNYVCRVMKFNRQLWEKTFLKCA